jgi:hypothetical protein
MMTNDDDEPQTRCSKCNRTEDELDEAGVDCDLSIFTECEECDPGGESRFPERIRRCLAAAERSTVESALLDQMAEALRVELKRSFLGNYVGGNYVEQCSRCGGINGHKSMRIYGEPIPCPIEAPCALLARYDATKGTR